MPNYLNISVRPMLYFKINYGCKSFLKSKLLHFTIDEYEMMFTKNLKLLLN